MDKDNAISPKLIFMNSTSYHMYELKNKISQCEKNIENLSQRTTKNMNELLNKITQCEKNIENLSQRTTKCEKYIEKIENLITKYDSFEFWATLFICFFFCLLFSKF
tara:strand:+ start:165 stop:485 length:321 start_codon:yes stop_codon:yes gene_type:complete